MAYPPSDPANNKADATVTATDHPAHHNALADAIIDIIDELGSAPKGGAADLTARLTALDTTVADKQPLDADLTAIAALVTTAYGRGLLTDADAAAFTARLTALLDGTYVPQDLSGLTASTAPDTDDLVYIWLDGAPRKVALSDLKALVLADPTLTGTVTVPDGALAIADTSGLQAALDAKLASSDYTAADVLAKLLTVDGAGSGLDADLLDGLSSAAFARSADFAFVRKTADEAVNNSSTVQDDDVLLFAIGSNEVWIAEFLLDTRAASSGTPDVKLTIAGPAGSSGQFTVIASTTAGAFGFPVWTALGTTVATGAATDARAVLIRAIIVNGATAGSVRLQWAQNTPTVEDVFVKANSYLSARKVA